LSIELTFTADGAPRAVTIRALVVAGWTGRDRAAVEHHIAELAELGVAPPSQVPLYYRLSPGLLTQDATVPMLGPDGSGEVEPMLLDDGDALWLGLGSDHTDRALEAVSVAFSKQVCAKPVGPELWRFNEVADRLDALTLESWISEDGAAWTPYQSGTLGSIRPLAELRDACPFARSGGRLEPGTLMLCGTLGAIGGVRPAPRFRMRLADPATGRALTHDYAVDRLPVIA
jgi:hypothetical protein